MKSSKKVVTLCVVVGLAMALALPVWAQDTAKININMASADELAQLKGVGSKYAERIVEYREKNGPFKSVQDIMKVPGIGQKTYEENQDRITVE